ncbi:MULTISPECIES: hypothetical protein [Streptomyces]|uniref:Uncharacterized protein n=1 Tax=Streptomyces tendae TaxID=1932 RepID=A0ABX5ZV43_STRTE|nr:hypothetical protein [Streptomyces tendae]QER88047.1 hypothetical protein F3L20_21370 [Streptomyces tendae]
MRTLWNRENSRGELRPGRRLAGDRTATGTARRTGGAPLITTADVMYGTPSRGTDGPVGGFLLRSA